MSNADFHLLPDTWQGRHTSSLKKVYDRAFAKAKELFVVSAFLTEWPADQRPNSGCEEFLLVIGTDFGITRIAAVKKALKSLGETFEDRVLAFNAKGVNFHPKVMLWKEADDSHFILIGSSNLTRAAFERNVEANVTMKLTKAEYENARDWMQEIEDASTPVIGPWLEKYQEAPLRVSGGSGSFADDAPTDSPVFDLSLGVPGNDERAEFDEHLERRREIRATFDRESKQPLVELFRRLARKTKWSDADDQHVYEELRRLWGASPRTRMGGKQWALRGKGTRYQQFVKSFVQILDAPSARARDVIVSREKDKLREAKVSARTAVFSELLCHFYPRRYPILDKPVKAWRREVGFDHRLGGTEGERYIRLAKFARAALRDPETMTTGVRDLAELDVLIWFQNKELNDLDDDHEDD